MRPDDSALGQRPSFMVWVHLVFGTFVLALYFLALAIGTCSLGALAWSSLCGSLPTAWASREIACGAVAFGLATLGSAFFFVFAAASGSLFAIVFFALGPAIFALGTVVAMQAAFGLKMGLVYSGVTLAGVSALAYTIWRVGMILQLWNSCAGNWRFALAGAGPSAAQPPGEDLQWLVESLCAQAVVEGKDLLCDGMIEADDLHDMSSALIIGLPAVTVFRSLLRTAGMGNRIILLAGTTVTESVLHEPRTQKLTRAMFAILGQLQTLQLTEEEGLCITRWLLGGDHVAPCESRKRAGEIGTVVAAMNGLAIEVTRSHEFKRLWRQMLEEITAPNSAF